MPHRFEKYDLKRTFDSLPQDFVEQQQKVEDKRNTKDFQELCDSLKLEQCSLCGHPLDYCYETSPCFHVLLNPRIKRKVRESLFSKPVSFFKLYSYLTWVANSNQPFTNINDIPCDTAGNLLFESTIRYKNIEWSFSLKKSDFEGHIDKKVGKISHYHFQMTADGNVVIPYNQTHIQFTPEDFFYIEMIRQKVMKPVPQYAAGMDSLRDKVCVNRLSSGDFEFLELISEKVIHRTIVLAGTITIQQIEEIGDFYSNSELEVYQIIEKLNSNKGYDIKYLLYELSRENPVKKATRD